MADEQTPPQAPTGEPVITPETAPVAAQEPAPAVAEPAPVAQDPQTGTAPESAPPSPPAEELADPTKPIDELPVGVVTGGQPMGQADDRPKDEPTPEPKAPGTVIAQPVRVDGRNRRSADDALEGHWVKVVGGDHDGQKAAFVSAVEYDMYTGYPTKALVRFKDTTYTKEYDVVDYESLRPTTVTEA